MWCCRCNNDLVNCTCPDIEERLASLAGGPAEIAAGQNLLRRKAAQIKKEASKRPDNTTKVEKCQHQFKVVDYKRKCTLCGIVAHENGDYSYLCGSEYCRCCQ